MSQLPELPFLRNSERAALKTCPAKWNWGWNEGLTLQMPLQSAAWFGGIVHVALAQWYGPAGAANGFVRGRDPRETLAEGFKNEYTTISAGPYWDEVAEKEYWDAAELGKIMMTAYLAEYGTDDQWEVLLPEMRFREKIPYNKRQRYNMDMLGQPVYNGDQRFITRLVGTFDMPVRDHTDGHVKVVDHKTTNKKENIAWLEKDDQTGTYIAVSTVVLRRMGLISDKEAVVGAIWNYLRKGKPDPRPKDALGRCTNKPTKTHYVEQLEVKLMGYDGYTLKKMKVDELEALAAQYKIEVLGDVSLTQPSDLFWRIDLRRNRHNRLRQLERIADDAETIAAIKSGRIPVLKNPAEHCGWCEFKELCSVDEDGGDVEQFKKDVFRKRDMYADHRPDAENSKLVIK
jgi:hypothetical protein